MSFKYCLIPVAILCNVLLITTNFAQTTTSLPNCVSVDSDSDGDGFGFENNQSCIVVGGQAMQARIGQCIDTDGDGFGWNGVATCDPTSSNTTVSMDTDGLPVFTNLETGEPVNLMRASWNPDDIELTNLVCTWFEFDGESYSEIGLLGSQHTGIHHRPLTEAAPSTSALHFFTAGGNRFDGTWFLNDGAYNGNSSLEISPFVEVVEQLIGGNDSSAVRLWMQDSHFLFCGDVTSNSFRPTGQTAAINIESITTSSVDDNCDYSDAILNSGYGWDPVARESCSPLETLQTEDQTDAVVDNGNLAQVSVSVSNNNCDYSDALLHNGYGFDPVARESCPPFSAADLRNAFDMNSSLGPDALVSRPMNCQSIESGSSFGLDVGFAFTGPFGNVRYWLNTTNRLNPLIVNTPDSVTTYEFFADTLTVNSSGDARFTDSFPNVDGASPTFRDQLEFRFLNIGGLLMAERTDIFTSLGSPALPTVSYFACDRRQ